MLSYLMYKHRAASTRTKHSEILHLGMRFCLFRRKTIPEVKIQIFSERPLLHVTGKGLFFLFDGFVRVMTGNSISQLQ